MEAPLIRQAGRQYAEKGEVKASLLAEITSPMIREYRKCRGAEEMVLKKVQKNDAEAGMALYRALNKIPFRAWDVSYPGVICENLERWGINEHLY